MNYRLEELIDVKKFQEMLDTLYEAFSITSALVDKESKVLCASGWQDICTHYPRVNSFIGEKCRESDRYIFSRINESNSTVTYKCPMGLIDSATPVIIGGKHLGNVFIGQFFLEEPDFDCFKKQANEYGFNEKGYLKALAKVPILTRDQLGRNLNFIRKLAELIAETGLKRLKLIENEQRFLTIFDSVNDAIFIQDPETGEILDVNAAMTSMYGFTREEARQIKLGTISSGVPPFTDKEALGHLRGAAEGEPRIFEWHARKKDGALFWVEVSMRKAHIADREFILSTVRDISERKRAEEELRTCEYRWKFALEGSGQGVWDWNLLSGEVQYSSLYREMLGYSEAEFPNRLEEWEKRVHPEDKAYVREEHRLHFENQTPVYVTEHRLLCKDGTWKWVLSRGMVVSRDAEGKTLRMIGTHTDITERKRLEDALLAREQEFRAMIENAPDPIFRYDRECHRIYVNPASERISGKQADSLLGNTPRDGMLLSPTEGDKIVSCVRQVLETGMTTENEVVFEAQNGVKRYFLNRYAPECGKDGNVSSVLLISRDITALKQAEMELQSKNSELERFTFTVSHDLKSPLITIKSFSGSIKNDLASGRHDRLEKDLNRISAAADRMAVLLDDLLQLSRVGHVINTPEQVDMAKLVHDVLKSMAGTLKENGVQVSVKPGLPTVPCDRQRMMEVVQNLLENAVKYRGAQPEPRILIGLREEGDRQVFFVQDNGPGIDPKFHENIFGLFNRLSTQVPGTGIGLALVKRIIEAHGGNIWAESDGCGEGSTFCFTVRR